MNQLITIGSSKVGEGTIQTVNARELHSFLESKQQYADWIKNRIKKYNFVDGVDFTTVHKIMNGAPSIDYHLSLDMAKELSMVERNAKGKEARQYFIECEKAALSSPALADLNDPAFLRSTLLTYTEKVIELESKIEADRPKTIFADAVSVSHTTILVGDLAKLLKQNGIDIGQKRLFDWLREKGYLIKTGSSWNMPTQKSMELGLMQVKESTVQNADGSVRITKTTKITGKGQLYFVNVFLRRKAA